MPRATKPVDDRFYLDPNDPFDAALIPLVETNRRKRKDYALDGDPFSNFTETAVAVNFKYRWMSPYFNCAQKEARITSLLANGRFEDPANEASADTILDHAVYAVITWAIYVTDQGKTLREILAGKE